jgi:hypothetical protein
VRGWEGVWGSAPENVAKIFMGKGFGAMQNDRRSAQWLEGLLHEDLEDLLMVKIGEFWDVACYNGGDPRKGTLKTKYSKGSGLRRSNQLKIPLGIETKLVLRIKMNTLVFQST